MVKEAYSSVLAQNILQITGEIGFGINYECIPVDAFGVAEAALDTIGYLDNKAKLMPEDGFATVFEGLDFDPHRVRSQAFVIIDKLTEVPIAVSTWLVAPSDWIETRRYFERVDGGIVVRDFRAVVESDNFPKFLFFPGWTYVDPKYRLLFALPGLRSIKKVFSIIEQEAPESTWIEEVPRGTWPRGREKEILALADYPVGTFISVNSLPFDISVMGRNSKGSAASVKVASYLGLHRVENVCSVNTLGPIYAKRVR